MAEQQQVEKNEKEEKQEKEKEEVKKALEEKTGERVEEKKEKVESEKLKKPKKSEAVVNARELKISRKHASAICNAIRGMTPPEAVALLEQVTRLKRAIPMTGELPHRRGMKSGRYPLKAAKLFIKLIRGLTSNALVNGLELERIVIVEASAHSGGEVSMLKKGKLCHVKLVAREQDLKKKEGKKADIKIKEMGK